MTANNDTEHDFNALDTADSSDENSSFDIDETKALQQELTQRGSLVDTQALYGSTTSHSTDGENTINLGRLPHLQEINKKLVGGFHICEHNLGLWQELDQNEDAYIALFKGLGYRLQRDSRGFFFIDSDESTVTMGKTSRAFALTIYTLVEYFANKGYDPIRALFEQDIDLATLDAIVNDYSHLYEQIEIDSGHELRKEIITRMLRFGMAREYGGGYRLLPPIFRYLDALNDVSDGERELAMDNENDAAMMEDNA